jgi:spermidine/putrescine transport system permease protein
MATQNTSKQTTQNTSLGQKTLPQWLEPMLMLAPAGVWLGLMLVLPTLLIFELSLVPGIRPGDLVNPSGIGNYIKIIDPLTLLVVGRSIGLSVATTLLCLLLGFPVAYWIGILAPARWRNLLLLGFVLPLWTSSLLRSYAWISILRPTGVLNTVLNAIGLPSLDLFNQLPAVLIGMTYSLLPYMVLILYSSLEKLDRRLLEAAADLGATPWQTFWQVTVPQALPGITAGGLLVFINAIGDFVNPELLGGTASMTAARLVYSKFLGAAPDWGLGSAISMLLIMLVTVAIALMIKYGDRNAISS